MTDHSLDVDELLRQSRDKQVGLRVPLAVDQRLDALVDRAVVAGERTSRREVLAAIICDGDWTGEELGTMLRKFRRMTVGEALLDLEAEANVVSLAAHRPGPRTARRS